MKRDDRLDEPLNNDDLLITRLIQQLYRFETRTGRKPTRIRLGSNKLRTYREEARLFSAFDTVGDDSFEGIRIVPARHPDDMIIDAGEGEE